MALINCPKCGKIISDKAVKCPHCGAPVLIKEDSKNIIEKEEIVLSKKTDAPTSKEKGANLFLIISSVVVLILIIIGVIEFSSKQSNNNNYTTEYVASNDVETISVDEVNQESSQNTNQTKEQKIIGVYRFHDKYNLNKWELSINSDGTCTLFEARDIKGIWRGAWKYYRYNDFYSVRWSSCDNPYENNLPFTSKYNYIDGEARYIYASDNAREAKDPNARYELIYEAEYDAKLNKSKNFTSLDLSALMLHGKVKSVTYYKGAGYRTKFDFDESGALINYEENDDEFGNIKYEIHHEGNRLVLVQAETFGSQAEVYEIEGGKLVKYESGGDGVGERIIYSNFGSNNWPRTETLYDYSIEEDAWKMTKTNSLTYEDIDEHGNWKNKVDQDGFAEERRTIEYYPN